MSDPATDLASLLHAAFVEQAKGYTEVLQQVAELSAAWRRGEPINERLEQICARVQQITTADAELAPLKRQWEAAGRPTSEALRREMERIAALIRQLGKELQAIEEAARQRRDELAVELDVYNRRRQMQRAYLGDVRKT